MKSNLTIWALAAAVAALSLVSGFAVEGVSFAHRPLLAGKASLTSDGFEVSRTLGVAALLARQRAAGAKIVSIENGAVVGGFGEAIGADIRFGWPDAFIPHGSVAELEKRYGFDVDSIVAKVQERVQT